MDMTMHHQNNINVCAMCNTQLKDCIVRDNKCYCNTGCYSNYMFFNTMAQPEPAQIIRKPYRDVPEHSNIKKSEESVKNSRMYGKCATCRNTYNCKHGSIDMGDKWFCGKTCSQIYNSGNNVSYPATIFPCIATTYTVYPLSVNSRTGKIVF